MIHGRYVPLARRGLISNFIKGSIFAFYTKPRSKWTFLERWLRVNKMKAHRIPFNMDLYLALWSEILDRFIKKMDIVANFY